MESRKITKEELYVLLGQSDRDYLSDLTLELVRDKHGIRLYCTNAYLMQADELNQMVAGRIMDSAIL